MSRHAERSAPHTGVQICCNNEVLYSKSLKIECGNRQAAPKPGTKTNPRFGSVLCRVLCMPCVRFLVFNRDIVVSGSYELMCWLLGYGVQVRFSSFLICPFSFGAVTLSIPLLSVAMISSFGFPHCRASSISFHAVGPCPPNPCLIQHSLPVYPSSALLFLCKCH